MYRPYRPTMYSKAVYIHKTPDIVLNVRHMAKVNLVSTEPGGNVLSVVQSDMRSDNTTESSHSHHMSASLKLNEASFQ